ncbi:MAG: hypothetical protein ACOYLK_09660 [Sphingomonas sp.]|jgi:hypothetical protein
MTPDDPNRAEFDRRRKSRALVTALILGGLVALFYFITLARIGSTVS